MWTLIVAIVAWCDQERKEAKLGLSVAFFDLAIFMAIEALLVAITKTLLSPIVMWVGIVWIITTALAIFWRGGLIVDSLLLAKALKLEIGDVFGNAALVFGIIHIWIVSFFMFIPVWQFWAGFPAILIALMGWMFSAPLTDVKFNWNYVRRAYRAMVPTIAALIIIVALFKSFGSQVSIETVRASLGGYGIWLMAAVCMLILGAIPKMPARKLLQVAGVITILIIIFATFAWPSAKKELTEMKKESDAAQSRSGRQTECVEQEPVAETATVTVIVPANKTVKTGFRHPPNKRIYFDIIGGGADNPATPIYYVHGKTVDIPVHSNRHSCQYPREDYVWLKGGPVTSMVKISM
jgi:hypothetical protein